MKLRVYCKGLLVCFGKGWSWQCLGKSWSALTEGDMKSCCWDLWDCISVLCFPNTLLTGVIFDAVDFFIFVKCCSICLMFFGELGSFTYLFVAEVGGREQSRRCQYLLQRVSDLRLLTFCLNHSMAKNSLNIKSFTNIQRLMLAINVALFSPLSSFLWSIWHLSILFPVQSSFHHKPFFYTCHSYTFFCS